VRGGEGIIKEIEFLTGADVTLLSDRRKRAPYGLEGGGPGATGRNALNGEPVRSKGTFRARSGDRLRIETPGGGGFGPVDVEDQRP
jgi:N-methylhydantoinase B